MLPKSRTNKGPSQLRESFLHSHSAARRTEISPNVGIWTRLNLTKPIKKKKKSVPKWCALICVFPNFVSLCRLISSTLLEAFTLCLYIREPVPMGPTGEIKWNCVELFNFCSYMLFHIAFPFWSETTDAFCLLVLLLFSACSWETNWPQKMYLHLLQR